MDDMFELSEDNQIHLSNLRSKIIREINTALLKDTKQALRDTKKAELELFSSNTQQFGIEEFATTKDAIYPKTLKDDNLQCNDSPLAHTTARKPQGLDNEGGQFQFDYATLDNIQRQLWEMRMKKSVTNRARHGACSQECDSKEPIHPTYTKKQYVDIMNQIYLHNLKNASEKKTLNLDKKYMKTFTGYITNFNTNENNEILSMSLQTEHNEMVSFEANATQNTTPNDYIIILSKVEEIQNNDSANISLRNDSSYEDMIDGNRVLNNAHYPNYTLRNLSQNQCVNQNLMEAENIEKNTIPREYCSDMDSDWLIDFSDTILTNSDGVENSSSSIECSNKNDREQDLTISNYKNETEVEYEAKKKNEKNVVGKEDKNNAQESNNTTVVQTCGSTETPKFKKSTVKNKLQITPRCNNYLSQNNKKDTLASNRVKANKFTKDGSQSKQGELNSLKTVIPRYPNYLRHYNDPNFLVNKKVAKSHDQVPDEIIKHPRYPNYLKGHNVTKVNVNNQIKKTVKSNVASSMVLPTNFKKIKQKANLAMRKSYTDNPIIPRSNKIPQIKEDNAKGMVSNVKKIILKHTSKSENTKSSVKSVIFCRPDAKDLNTSKQDEIRNFTANNICVQLETIDKVNATENDEASEEIAAKLVSNGLKKCGEMPKVENVAACKEIESDESYEQSEKIKTELDCNELKGCEEISQVKNTVGYKELKSDEKCEQNVVQLVSNGLKNNTQIPILIKDDAASEEIKYFENHKHSTQDAVKPISCSLMCNKDTSKLNNETASKKAKFYENDGYIEEVVANQLSNGLQENKILAKFKQDSKGFNKIEEIPNEINEQLSEKIKTDENYELSEHAESKHNSNCIKEHVTISKMMNKVAIEEVASHENYNQNEHIAAKVVSDGFNKNEVNSKQIDMTENEKTKIVEKSDKNEQVTVKLISNGLKKNEEIPKQINKATRREFNSGEDYEQSKQGSAKLQSNGFKMHEEIPTIMNKPSSGQA
ncbi:uncharacterized protein LOC119673938 [Teleopsis dalmanni]|uniref:uncharacterized protein LOC119673938 n=1 Tax=Teleopsis dalmanni TaxID=139649 RepID=UPI0018CF2E8D|nr:uncharacterized protein LOC119673938 [Teleopsis dalmanni]